MDNVYSKKDPNCCAMQYVIIPVIKAYFFMGSEKYVNQLLNAYLDARKAKKMKLKC